jgi:adenylate cyclase
VGFAISTNRRIAFRLQLSVIRKARLYTGLILFTYITAHLLNHSLGNFSLTLTEDGLRIHKFVWQSAIGTAVLYGAFIVHFSLGLYALYERRMAHWSFSELAQLLFGLAVPPLLATHLAGTRIAFAAYGIDKGYAQVLYSFWASSPYIAIIQQALLIVAWTHGCIGIWFWLRLQPWFARARSLLLCFAVLLPVLALLGFLQAGREVVMLAHDPAWRATALSPVRTGVLAQNLWLTSLRDNFLMFDGGAIVLVLLARFVRVSLERRKPRFTVTYPDGRRQKAPVGYSVLEVSRMANIPHAAVCGGRGRCTLCRVRLMGAHDLEPPSTKEWSLLRRLGADAATVRQACQIRPTRDISVVPLVPAIESESLMRRRHAAAVPQERFLVFVFIDMRDSTRLAASRPPYDAMFILGRFVNAVSEAVVAAGGQAAEFRGDAVVAGFGRRTDARTACRQAVSSLSLIAQNINRLSDMLRDDLGGPLRFAIGVDGSSTVSGEIGFGDHTTVTAFGEALSVAARLQDLTKELACEALVSDEVMRLADIDVEEFPLYTAVLRGFERPIEARIIHSVSVTMRSRDYAFGDGIRSRDPCK